jgi:hypothetical protein
VSKVQNADSASAYLNQTANIVYTPGGLLRWIRKTGANPGAHEGYSYDAAGCVRITCWTCSLKCSRGSAS